jgi:hypothetical protein
MPPALTYALLAACAAAFLSTFWMDRQKDGTRWAWTKRWTFVIQIGAIVGAYLVVRPGAGDDDGRKVLADAAASNRPVFVDLYSNF